EGKAKGTNNVYELELLSNLWKVLFSLVRTNRIAPEVADLDARASTLLGELERLASEQDRPSSSLNARSIWLVMQMLIRAPDGIEECLNQLRSVVLESKGLVGFQLLPLVEALTSVGDVLGTYPSYDALHETIIEVVTAREGDVAAAKLLVQRGA